MIRVVIADDHRLVREGIRSLLEKTPDIQVIGEAKDGNQAVELTGRLAPDVLVLDIAMGGLTGIQAVERIRALDVETQVVVLSMYADRILVQQALQYGAKGYLDKGSFSDELQLAIRAAHRGATYLSPTVSESVLPDGLSYSEEPAANLAEQLTSREHEVLQLISEGHTNAAMAKMMDLSVKTVERHRTNLMAKLDVHNLVGLIRVAARHGLIHFNE